ncbi:hypothetical protein Q7P37_003339 [Cladosporium fusiforme]
MNSDLRYTLHSDSHRPPASGQHPHESFDWDDVKASPHLQYTPCYGDLQCARLELPMDWFNHTTNATISLAVVRQPAVVPVTHPQYGGAVLLNPGGPGGSGIGLVLIAGEYARSVLDTNSTEGKYFDVMSFDPRGVGLSTPRVDCSHDPNLDASWQLRLQEEGWFESSDAALGRIWSMSDARWQGCSKVHGHDDSNIKQYISTASVARDMLEIVERHGEWREKEAESLLQSTKFSWLRPFTRCNSRAKTPAPLQHHHGKEKILYYGMSYGSYLGGTFAAMFPDRIERLVVDGVVEYGNYLSGNWSSNLVDTEKTMDLFYFHCARVGYPNCPLANSTGKSSPESVKKRTDSIINSLYHNPLPFYEPADVLSYSEIRSLIFGALYSPVQTFYAVAHILHAIEQKNRTILEPFMGAIHRSACASDNWENPLATTQDAQVAIACSDGNDQSYVDRASFQAFAKDLAAQSPSSGSIWSTIRLNCIHYTLPAVHRFTGPWRAKTSHPLLLIGNTADPVTPGRYAQKMAEGFEGAVALIQDSGGHCSAAAYSRCTVGYIRQYFQTGELPPVNTTCAVDVLPFGPTPGEVMIEDEEIKLAAERHQGFADAILEHGAGFLGGRQWYNARKLLSELQDL